MSVAESVASSSVFERQRIEALLARVMPVAKGAEGIACAIVNKVRNVALLGSASALWLTLASALSFNWGLTAAVSMLVPMLVPSLILWKIHGTLRGVVGLPERLVATSDRMFGKYAEYRELHLERQLVSEKKKTKFRELWRTARSMLELKSLGDQGREVWGTMAGAIVMASPVFAIVLAVCVALCLVMVGVAAIVGLVFVL